MANNPATWGTFEQSTECALRLDHAGGVGFMLTGGSLVGIDFDHVIDKQTGELCSGAADLLRELTPSYVERSPSGDGLHCFLRGDVPKTWASKAKDAFGPGKDLEVYCGSDKRYFTVTGNRWSEETEISDATDNDVEVLATFMEKKAQTKAAPGPRFERSSGANDDLDRARFGLLELGLLDDHVDDRDAWINVLVGLKALDAQALAIEWSRRSDKFVDGEVEKLWPGISGTCAGHLFGKFKAANPGWFAAYKALHQQSHDNAQDFDESADDDGTADEYVTFPVDALPRLVRNMVEHGAQAQSVDVGFWAVTALPLLAGCIGNSRRVVIKRGWVEPCVLFAAVIGSSGVGKSAGLRELAKPIRHRDKVLAMQNQDAVEVHQAECASAKEAKEPPPPPPPILSVVLDDATLEAVGSRLADNPRGLILINDELAGWLKSMDKYRAGDDKEKWLRINGADSVKFDRKGGQRQLFVPRAAVSVVGGMQPKVAARHLAGEAIESGASARILIARPPARPALWTDDEIPESVLDGWRRLCDSLLDLTHDPDEPRTLPLSVDARKLFVPFNNQNARATFAAGESGDSARSAVLSKLRGYAARLALIFELCNAAENGTAELVQAVGKDAMAAGIAVVDWFAAEAAVLYREFAAATPDAEQRLDGRILAILRDRGQLSEGAIRDALHRHPSSDDVCSSLRRLEASGHVKFAGTEPTGGRPRRMWELAQ